VEKQGHIESTEPKVDVKVKARNSLEFSV